MAAELTDLRQRRSGSSSRSSRRSRTPSRRYVRTKGTWSSTTRAVASVREVPVPDVPLLPESEREVTMAVIDPEKKVTLEPGEYRVELRIDVGLPALLVGETTLKVPR